MNITKENLNDLNAVVSIKLVAEDYHQKVEDVLKDYRKKAKVDGFRPGMVPLGLIKKIYYKPILADEINKLVSESLMNYIQDEKLRILGEPLPHAGQENSIDFDNDTEFEFSFDIGIVPDFKLNISNKDKIIFYTIKVEDKVIDEYEENVTKRFGDFLPVKKAKGDELIKGILKQVDDTGNIIEGGFSVDEASFSLDMIKDEAIKKLFVGSKPGGQIIFDLRKAFPNDPELVTLLKIDREKAAEITGPFQVNIKEILKFEKHPVDQDLFNKTFGEGIVKSEEEFREKIIEEIKANLERESNYRFALDCKKYLIKKAGLTLPVDFLKRWLLETNDKIKAEQIDKEFEEYEEEFEWQLIKDQMVRENEISVSEEELFEYAFMMARNQFYQYGLYNVPDEHIEKYAREQLTRKEDARRLRDQKYEDKIITFMKDTVKLDKKDITSEKFKKLFEK
jgi:trigger factor